MRKYSGFKGALGFNGLVAIAIATMLGCAASPAQKSSNIKVNPATPMTPAKAPPAPAMQVETVLPQDESQTFLREDETPALREDAPIRYVVKKGDTLWGIANRYLIEPWQWPEIWVVNSQVRNPHLIYPGDELLLIWRDGRPRVERELPADRLSPQVRESDLGEAIPTIPIEAIRDFLRSPRLVTLDQLKSAPYVLDFVDLHIVGGAGDGAFVKKLKSGGNVWDVVRLGERYVDPDSKELLGYEAIPVAEADVREFGDPGTVMLRRSFRESKPGDYLIKPLSESFDSNFYPHAPAQPVDARILSVFDGVSQIGQYQVVALSRGAVDGLEAGHVLDILQSGRSAKDPYGSRYVQLPDTYAGQMLVFKTEQRVSYALVMSAIREVHVLDKAVNPGRRPALK